MTFSNLSASSANLLLTIFLIELAAGFGLLKWLSSKNAPEERNLTPQGRTRVYIYLLVLLLILVMTVTVGGILSHFDRPFYAVQGASKTGWVLSPAHYYIFLTCYPIYFFSGGAMYILVKKCLPSLLPRLKWPIIISAAIPFLFIPAIDGNLLDQTITVPEVLYIAFYWVANLAWIGLGLGPITYFTLKRFLGELTH